MRVAVPKSLSSTAHTTSGDLSRITSTLTGPTTFAALCSAEQAMVRAMDNLRTMRASVRALKKEARALETRDRVKRETAYRDGMEIPV